MDAAVTEVFGARPRAVRWDSHLAYDIYGILKISVIKILISILMQYQKNS